MSIVVTTAAELKARRLVTLDYVKSRLGIVSTSSDEILEGFIDEASQIIVDYLDTDLVKQTYTETVAGTGGTKMVLSRSPIVSISSITLDGTAVTDYSVMNARAGILYRESGWTLKAQSFSRLTYDPFVNYEEADWTIVYDAGYTLPAGVAPSAGDFELSIAFRSYASDMVSYLFRQKSTTGKGLKSRTMGGPDGMSEEYFSASESIGSTGIPLEIEKQLDGWKQFA
jgi:hypothetical protein